MKLAGWGANLLDLLLPAGCIACGTWIPGGRRAPLVCARCTTRLRRAAWPRCPRCDHPRASGRPSAERCTECEAWPEALTFARHAYVLGPPAEDLVHALKYEGWPELADVMGDAMAGVLARVPVDAARRRVVVPVPTTERRRRRRGYNQAELLARRVARTQGLPLRSAIVRTGARASQTGLAPTARRENVRGVFSPASREGTVRGADVLLVDDVLTTGATASEAAAVLADMGALTVTLITYARALVDAPENPGKALS